MKSAFLCIESIDPASDSTLKESIQLGGGGLELGRNGTSSSPSTSPIVISTLPPPFSYFRPICACFSKASCLLSAICRLGYASGVSK
jgi:hypothetical protein